LCTSTTRGGTSLGTARVRGGAARRTAGTLVIALETRSWSRHPGSHLSQPTLSVERLSPCCTERLLAGLPVVAEEPLLPTPAGPKEGERARSSSGRRASMDEVRLRGRSSASGCAARVCLCLWPACKSVVPTTHATHALHAGQRIPRRGVQQ